MKSNTVVLFTAATMGTGTLTSPAIEVDQIWGYAVQALWTGTPVGTLSLQASSVAPPNPGVNSDGGASTITLWDTITGSPYTISGAPGSYMWNVTTASYRYFQLVYTGISGAGSLSAIVSLKGI